MLAFAPHDDTSGITTAGDFFMHEPLDYSKRSLRLLRVEPENSPDGFVQCTMVQSIIDADYNCLSYTWGEPTPCHKILVNGKVVYVRQNLVDFLCEARKMESGLSQWLWIDAIWYVNKCRSETSWRFLVSLFPHFADRLSIDQNNNDERSHQVQQMGMIFEHAQCVLLWLGKLESFAPIVDILNNRGLSAPLSRRQEAIIYRKLFHNRYWTRAWVTQEIALARSVIIVLDGTVIDYQTLRSNLACHFHSNWSMNAASPMA
jgi:hypothetical protein